MYKRVTEELLRQHLGDASIPMEHLGPVIAAANYWVADIHPGDWTEDILLGATMLAATLYRRRNSPGGIEVFGDGSIAHVVRSDPHVSMLLGLGGWTKPQLG